MCWVVTETTTKNVNWKLKWYESVLKKKHIYTFWALFDIGIFINSITLFYNSPSWNDRKIRANKHLTAEQFILTGINASSDSNNRVFVERHLKYYGWIEKIMPSGKQIKGGA